MLRSIALLSCLIGASSFCLAQSGKSSPYLSEGLRAFHRGDYQDAINAFNTAEANGSKDCRLYMMRGISKLRTGQFADQDLQAGANLEVASGRSDIGRSLERIQGSDRLVVERFRRMAKRQSQLASSQAKTKASPTVDAPKKTTNFRLRSDYEASPAPARLSVTEIPLVTAEDPSDPFADGAADLLGRGVAEAAAPKPEEPAVSDLAGSDNAEFDAADDDAGFGSDDADTGSGSDDADFGDVAADDSDDMADDGFDFGDDEDTADFASDDTNTGDDDDASFDFGDEAESDPVTATESSPSGKKKRGGIFGVFGRAIGGVGKRGIDAASKAVPIPPIGPGMRGPGGPGGPGPGGPGGPGPGGPPETFEATPDMDNGTDDDGGFDFSDDGSSDDDEVDPFQDDE